MPRINRPVPGAKEYYPLNDPPIGTLFSSEDEVPKLFKPLTIRGVTFPNRIFVAPMCQYSSDDGHATDWHLVHIGGFATKGLGGIVLEATSVTPEGRISPEDAGLWKDSQIPPLKRIVDFAHSQGAKIGVQLGHAGRKASTLAPWVYQEAARKAEEEGKTRGGVSPTAGVDEGGWPDDVLGSSEVPHADTYPKPKALDEEGLKRVEDAFVSAIERCKQIGFDFIQLHFAHGYLLHTFLSPLSNTRIDAYGGAPLANRIRFPLQIAKACREAWDGPLVVRISASDQADELGAEGSEEDGWKWWGVEQSKVFVGELEKLGIDMVDVSSGGLYDKQKIDIKPGYQVSFAESIKRAHPSFLISTVGLITKPKQANDILESGAADAVCLAREMIRSPYWAAQAAQELGVGVKIANQYERGWVGRVPGREQASGKRVNGR